MTQLLGPVVLNLWVTTNGNHIFPMVLGAPNHKCVLIVAAS